VPGSSRIDRIANWIGLYSEENRYEILQFFLWVWKTYRFVSLERGYLISVYLYARPSSSSTRPGVKAMPSP
jgi:hypothetical protein